MGNLIRQIKISFRREKPLFALIKIARYGYYLIRSLPLSWSLNAPGLYIGPRFLLLGTKYIRIGRNFYAHSNLWIEAVPEYKGQKFKPGIIIGKNVSMGDSVHLSCNSGIIIGDNVLFGSNIFLGDHQHGIYSGSAQTNSSLAPASRPLSSGIGIEIGSNTWIGNNVVITGNVTIGSGCVIAANSVVNKNFAANTIIGGTPARAIKKFVADKSSWI